MIRIPCRDGEVIVKASDHYYGSWCSYWCSRVGTDPHTACRVQQEWTIEVAPDAIAKLRASQTKIRGKTLLEWSIE